MSDMKRAQGPVEGREPWELEAAGSIPACATSPQTHPPMCQQYESEKVFVDLLRKARRRDCDEKNQHYFGWSRPEIKLAYGHWVAHRQCESCHRWVTFELTQTKVSDYRP